MTLFLIPARAGSKRLPGKNKRLFCGIPLWQWAEAQALRVYDENHDGIIVSTDDDDILFTSHRAHYRPKLFCGDEVPMQEVVDFYMALLQQTSLCLLQPTSPTRSDSLVRSMIARGDACRSVTDSVPNGQCYVYRQGMAMVDVETAMGHDINLLSEFQQAEAVMLRRFA